MAAQSTRNIPERSADTGVFAETMLQWAGGFLIVTIGLIYLLQANELFAAKMYLGLLFLANFTASSFAGAVISLKGSRWAWLLADLICVLAIAGFFVSRTSGLPGYPEAVGQWLNFPAISSVLAELLFLALSALALTLRGRRTVEAEQEKLDREAANSPDRLERSMAEIRSRMAPDLRDLRARAEPRTIKSRATRRTRERLYGLLRKLR